MKAAAGYVNQPASADPRSTEAWALAEASRRLVLAARAEDEGASLRDALILNQRLWSIFQGSLIDPSCQIPKAIRDNVLALSIMVDRHILQRLADLDGTKIQPILDINRAIAEGLATQAPETAAPAQTAKPAPIAGSGATPFMNVTA